MRPGYPVYRDTMCFLGWHGQDLASRRIQPAIQSLLSRHLFVWHRQPISPSTGKCTGFYPKHFRKGTRNSPATSLTPPSWRGCAPVSKHTASAPNLNNFVHLQLVCNSLDEVTPCSAFLLFPRSILSPSVSLWPTSVSFSVPVSLLSF